MAAREALEAGTETDDESRLVVDIVSSRGHFGRLAAFYPQNYHFLPQERSLLMAYTGHAAAALDTAAALDESRDRNTTLSALLALGKALAEESTRAQVAQRLADAVLEIADCDEAHVLLWDAGDAHLARVASSLPPSSDRAEPEATALRIATVADRLLSMAAPTFVSVGSDPVLGAMLSLTGLESGVVVPITARSTFFGVLLVGSDGRELRPDDVRRERLSGVASLAATALDGMALLDEVRHQALHDPITDLANSRLFEDRVAQALSIARRNQNRLAVLFVDLDRFKSVNDSHGHKVGDELLRAVAERLLGTVREEDTVARIGGDEFGILVQQASGRDDAEAVSHRIVSALGRPFVVHGLTLSVGASVGVTLFPDPHDTYDSVVSRADSAMYRAKARGRGRYEMRQATDGWDVEPERR